MKFKAVFFGLLLSLSMLNGIKSQSCNYRQQLQGGQTYYLYNSEYPSKNYGKEYCEYQALSDYSISYTSINCTIDILSSENCDYDSLSIISENNDYPHKYCGKGTFVYFDKGKDITIIFEAKNGKKGNKYFCSIKGEKHNCRCGWKNPTKIVGGEETGVNEYPMMAGLVDSTTRIIYCGATIISKDYVLTAAHCVIDRNINEIGVIVGEHDVTTGKETNATKLYRIKKYIVHPEYNSNTNINDIAICKTNDIIEYNAKVGPACLPFQHRNDSFMNDTVTLLGWGTLGFGDAPSTKLQKVDVNVAKCKYPNPTNLCTYAPKKDACQMDSGGPVLWQDPLSSRLVMVGIISSGDACASKNPGINTRVGTYISWIKSTTRDAEYCESE